MFAPNKVGNEGYQRAQVHARAARAEGRLQIAQHKRTFRHLVADAIAYRVDLAPKAMGCEPNPQPNQQADDDQ